ncbi:hypothetical protein ACQKJC_22090 [Priestia koreensis]|uniref:hypothetical protein n=1 Tax=Priestia koreensis TaxID=284581 RepID=UPI003CFFD948
MTTYFFEANDVENDQCIYFGSNREQLIHELTTYIKSQPIHKQNVVSEKDIENLNSSKLDLAGIEVFFQ